MWLSPDDHLQPLTPTGAFHIRRRWNAVALS
jgi:hypothetical protein